MNAFFMSLDAYHVDVRKTKIAIEKKVFIHQTKRT